MNTGGDSDRANSELGRTEPEAEDVANAVTTTIEQELIDLAPQTRERVIRAAVRVIRQQLTVFQGPLPPPTVLQEYEKIVPGAADRILKMAEQNQRSRLSWYSSAMFNMRLGLIFGFFIALCLVGGALYCASIGHWGAALAFLGASAAGMVPALIRGWGANRPPLRPDEH